VALAISGGFSNTGSVASTPLSNTSMSTVCADPNGKVILCSTANVCSNIPGSTTLPAGYVTNTDGTCSVAGKRFLSIRTSGQDAPVTYNKFVGGIVNGNFIDHTAGAKQNNGAAPLVDTVGMDNNFPYGWVIDEIPGMQTTAFSGPTSQLLKVVDKGSYTFKISASGRIGIKGKFSTDQNLFGVDFYMKVHHSTDGSDQYIHLDNQTVTAMPAGATSSAVLRHETYPVSGKDFMDYGLWTKLYGSGAVFSISGVTGSGDQFAYAPYSTSFQQTLSLVPGDTVDLYVFMYGLSNRQDFINNSFNNFTDYIDTTDSTIDILEIPQ
jgi:hypothetical protein